MYFLIWEILPVCLPSLSPPSFLNRCLTFPFEAPLQVILQCECHLHPLSFWYQIQTAVRSSSSVLVKEALFFLLRHCHYVRPTLKMYILLTLTLYTRTLSLLSPPQPPWALTSNAEPPLCINASVTLLGLWISKLDYPPAWIPSSDSVSIYEAIGLWEPLL